MYVICWYGVCHIVYANHVTVEYRRLLNIHKLRIQMMHMRFVIVIIGDSKGWGCHPLRLPYWASEFF